MHVGVISAGKLVAHATSTCLIFPLAR